MRQFFKSLFLTLYDRRGRKGKLCVWITLGSLPLIILTAITLQALSPDLKSSYSSSRSVFDRQGKLLRLGLSKDEKYRLWTPLDQIQKNTIEATLIKEDRFFFKHPGFNPISLLRATLGFFRIRHSSWAEKSGASTITMQLARLHYGLQTRSVSGKLRQLIKAVQLELNYSKDEILEAYLNLIPMGGNIEGMGAASLIYFQKLASDLTLPESLALIEIPQNPNRRGLHHASTFLVSKTAIERWLKSASDKKNHASLERDTEVPIQATGLQDLPFEAPHWVELLLRRYPNETQLTSTLDLSLQKRVESLFRQYLSTIHLSGVKNGALQLIRASTMEVLVSIGSANYFEAKIAGQINGTEIKRSPGSALKPFIYALALDQGLIHPQSLLKDSPTSFGYFDPENFDRDFQGPLSATEALTRSRNVPAVYLYSKLDANRSLHHFLSKSGVTQLYPEKHYGYALPLGGAEVTMTELLSLYSVLRHQGEVYLPKVLLSTLPPERPTQEPLISPQAAFLVEEMLASQPRPDSKFSEKWLLNSVRVAWKTGTSHGFRDAWTIGVFGDYLLAVWLGDFNYESNSNLVGREIAAPLFFRVVDLLKARDPQLVRTLQKAPPYPVTETEVCAVSGGIPTRHCRHRKKTYFISGVSPIANCNIHREFIVDRRSGHRVCQSPTLGSRSNYIEKVYEVWPSDLLELFKKSGLARAPLPPFDPSCALESHQSNGRAPEITSPVSGLTYLYRFGSLAPTDEARRLALKAQVDGDVKELSWFINNTYIGKTKPEVSLFWQMHPGTHVVRAVDDQGRSKTQTLRVEVSQ
jgi:penicillin-binding protein 1C